MIKIKRTIWITSSAITRMRWPTRRRPINCRTFIPPPSPAWIRPWSRGTARESTPVTAAKVSSLFSRRADIHTSTDSLSETWPDAPPKVPTPIRPLGLRYTLTSGVTASRGTARLLHPAAKTTPSVTEDSVKTTGTKLPGETGRCTQAWNRGCNAMLFSVLLL